MGPPISVGHAGSICCRKNVLVRRGSSSFLAVVFSACRKAFSINLFIMPSVFILSNSSDNFASCSDNVQPYCNSTSQYGEEVIEWCEGVCKDISTDSIQNDMSYCCAFDNGKPNPDGIKHCCREEDACYDNPEQINQCPMYVLLS